MGATTYYQTSAGETASEAFITAVKDAQYESGHGGYTGTIAEKNTFTMATSDALSPNEAYALANSLIDSKYGNKWGPSGCIRLTSTARPQGWTSSESTDQVPEFLFFAGPLNKNSYNKLELTFKLYQGLKALFLSKKRKNYD